EGEVIISIPLNLILTYKKVNETLSRDYGLKSLSIPKLTSHQLLALYLVLESRKGKSSSINPYVQMLPKDFGSMPICYEDDWVKLVPDYMRVIIESQKSKFEKDFANVCDFSEAQDKICLRVTREEFLWGWLCVNTRCIYLENSVCDIRDNIAISPMLDFLNHSLDAKIKGGFNHSTQSYEITTFTPYKKGQQVFINYGPHDNYLTLLDYGFTISGNPFAYVLIDNEFFEYRMPGEDEWIKKFKFELLMENGFYGDYTFHVSQISFRLLTALRLRLLRFDEGDNGTEISIREGHITLSQYSQSLIKKWKSTLTGQQEIISNENEVEIYKWINDICIVKLNECRSKLEEMKSQSSLDNIKLLWNDSINILNSVIEYIKNLDQQDV
ncbi:3183_t:CDS:2, partial [Acaulospora morrowiae]